MNAQLDYIKRFGVRKYLKCYALEVLYFLRREERI